MNNNLNDIKIITGDDLADWIHIKGLSLFDYIFKIIIAIILFFLLCKILNKIINVIQSRLDKRGVDQIASHFILNLIRYSILIFAIFTVITQLKIVEVTSIAALIASAGVGISLAMQGALSNFAGGVLLLVLKPFKKGDYIVIPSAGLEGKVEEIQTYYTTIRTILDEVIKIPNSQLTNNSVVNKLGDENRPLLLKVNIAYDSDVKKAKAVLTNILDTQDGPIADGKSVFVEELGESSVEMGVLCTVPVNSYNRVRRELNERILLGLKEEGIEIPFNQLDVHLIN